MIDKKIINIAYNTSNVGLMNNYTHRSSVKNSICGDKITLELIANKKKVRSMKYETESCIYCEASASLLSRKIKKLSIRYIKKEFTLLKQIAKKKEIKIPKKLEEFDKLINSDNLKRLNCVILPFNAVLKALKL
tara:strand:- start:537 stop:938 length:402 start_codon:yes stop_codon:yes gene_type:complete